MDMYFNTNNSFTCKHLEKIDLRNTAITSKMMDTSPSNEKNKDESCSFKSS